MIVTPIADMLKSKKGVAAIIALIIALIGHFTNVSGGDVQMIVLPILVYIVAQGASEIGGRS